MEKHCSGTSDPLGREADLDEREGGGYDQHVGLAVGKRLDPLTVTAVVDFMSEQHNLHALDLEKEGFLPLKLHQSWFFEFSVFQRPC